MGTDRIRRLLTSKTAKLAQDTNTNIGVDFTSNAKPFSDPNLVDIINQNEVFQEEREEATKYRIYGNVKVITTNELSPTATDSHWALTKSNWEVQILYPSNKDYNYIINSRKGTETNGEAFRGVPLETQFIYGDTNRNKLAIQTNMKHNLQPLDYVYVYGEATYNNKGIHRVEKLGDANGENINYNFVTSTIMEDSQLTSSLGNLIKIVNPSENDIKYNNPLTISSRSATVDGLTTLTSTDHQVVVDDYVEIRSLVGAMNSIFLVKEIVDGNNFKIELGGQTTSSLSNTTFRRLDGTPSEYYVRKFEIINSSDYDTHKTAFSKSIYPKTLQNNLGVGNEVYSYQLNRDIDVGDFTSHRGGKLTELYAGFIKVSGGFDWSWVVSDWEDNYKSTTNDKSMELVSSTDTTQKNLGDEYIGDFVEFNRETLTESTINETIHRFTQNGNGDGYYLKPFKKLQIRVYSNNKEKSLKEENIINLPSDTITLPNGDRVWKDILSIGHFEEATNGVDYPFKNNSHYFYNNNILYVRVQNPIREGLVQETFKVGEVEC
jgi:hypothetical protein